MKFFRSRAGKSRKSLKYLPKRFFLSEQIKRSQPVVNST